MTYKFYKIGDKDNVSGSNTKLNNEYSKYQFHFSTPMTKKALLLFILLSLISCQNTQRGCPIPPAEFKIDDLVGTWESDWTERKDTLIIREDGKYKQVIHVENPPFDYESDWLSWRVEISDNGIPYMHLDGMRLCVYWEKIACSQIGGNGYDWYDFCKQEWVQMPHEGILMVLGEPEGFNSQPRGISLFALQKSTVGVTAYQLESP